VSGYTKSDINFVTEDKTTETIPLHHLQMQAQDLKKAFIRVLHHLN